MNTPVVSVVIETITARFDSTSGSLADDLAGTMAALEHQTYPRDRIEMIVVIDSEVAAETIEELRRRYPHAKLVSSQMSNYFDAKNAGASTSAGDFIALLDGDCQPSPDWIEVLVSRFEKGIDVVAGCTRYEGRSVTARTFSVPDFAYVVDDQDSASGFNINNVAFRRDVLLAHPFDARIRRNGGCFFLYHQLRAEGARIVYEPRAAVVHGLDIRGLGFVRKHFERGYDGVMVYHLDDRDVLRGTRYFRRAGRLALIALYARRVVVDWARMFRKRDQIGIRLYTVPYYGAITAMTRSIELAGALTAAGKK